MRNATAVSGRTAIRSANEALSGRVSLKGHDGVEARVAGASTDTAIARHTDVQSLPLCLLLTADWSYGHRGRPSVGIMKTLAAVPALLVPGFGATAPLTPRARLARSRAHTSTYPLLASLLVRTADGIRHNGGEGSADRDRVPDRGGVSAFTVS